MTLPSATRGDLEAVRNLLAEGLPEYATSIVERRQGWPQGLAAWIRAGDLAAALEALQDALDAADGDHA